MPRDQIFISYSRKDKQWLEQLLVTLRPLVKKREVDVWEDSRIAVGKKWKPEIARAIDSAKIAILLVSRHFLASEFIADNELPPLLAAAEKEGVRIAWIAVGHSLYEETEITEYQAAHDPSKPLNSLSEADLDKELVSIARIIYGLANTFTTSDIAPVVVTAASTPQESTQAIRGPALERIHRILAEGKFAWRSMRALARKTGLSESATLDLIRADPEIDISRGKSGNTIAKLRTPLN